MKFHLAMAIALSMILSAQTSFAESRNHEDPVYTFGYITESEYSDNSQPMVVEEEDIYVDNPQANNQRYGKQKQMLSPEMRKAIQERRSAIETLASDSGASAFETAIILHHLNRLNMRDPETFQLIAQKAHGMDVTLPPKLVKFLTMAFVLDKDGAFRDNLGDIVEYATEMPDNDNGNGNATLKKEYQFKPMFPMRRGQRSGR